jgi:hypothetical protein
MHAPRADPPGNGARPTTNYVYDDEVEVEETAMRARARAQDEMNWLKW